MWCNDARIGKDMWLQRRKGKINNDLQIASLLEVRCKIKETVMIDIQRRNKAIRKCFYEQLGKGMPVMELYVMIGKQFYLSEERVRQIVAKRKSR